ncbi:hypothetical protein VTL71DRAFT_12391 [Oculimacula yallundae]|uniref:Uncharacterized protein n=1 Tax=Oculimacula yallundae TaxID=86028 RepID=A0ABR4CMF6_9HELO
MIRYDTVRYGHAALRSVMRSEEASTRTRQLGRRRLEETDEPIQGRAVSSPHGLALSYTVTSLSTVLIYVNEMACGSDAENLGWAALVGLAQITVTVRLLFRVALGAEAKNLCLLHRWQATYGVHQSSPIQSDGIESTMNG